MKGASRWVRRHLTGLPWVHRAFRNSIRDHEPGMVNLPPATGDDAGARWPQVDEPIRSAAGDYLGRAPFALRAAHVLGELQSFKDSSVLALVGPWGSGKTSLINLICEDLGESWQVCHSNMWAPPDVAALLADLFATIRSALPENDQARRLKSLLAEYAQLATPALSILPVAGNAAENIAGNLVTLRAQRPMQPLFNELTGQMR